MKNMLRKIRSNKAGFSLTEVMVGMMILTVAIVSATNLLVGLIGSNKNVVEHMKAYYLAQEGVELVRNIRDTNWMQNVDWLEGGELAGWSKLEKGKTYSLDVGDYDKPWVFSEVNSDDYLDPAFELSGEMEGYYRHVNILPYECGEGSDIAVGMVVAANSADKCEDFAIVEVGVNWDDNEVVLTELLTNWKGGAL